MTCESKATELVTTTCSNPLSEADHPNAEKAATPDAWAYPAEVRKREEALIRTVAEFQKRDDLRGRDWWRKNAAAHPTVVGVHVGFEEVRAIDPVQGKFEASIQFMMYWHDPSLVNHKGLNVSVESSNAPALSLINIDSVLDGGGQLDENGDIIFSKATLRRGGEDDPEGLMYHAQKYRATFRQWVAFKDSMDLHSFPFDVHRLSIVVKYWGAGVKSEGSVHHGRLLFPTDLCDSECNNAEWSYYAPAAKALNVERGSKQHLKFILPVERRSGYYIWQVMATMAAIGFLGLTVFALEPSEFGDRVGVTLTLLLTHIAFKFAISDSIPKVPYSTAMDKFAALSYSFMALITIESALASLVANSEEFAKWERIISASVFALMWLGMHSYYFCRVNRLRGRVAAEHGQPSKDVIIEDYAYAF